MKRLKLVATATATFVAFLAALPTAIQTSRDAPGRLAALLRKPDELTTLCVSGPYFRDDPRYDRQVRECPREPGMGPWAPHPTEDEARVALLAFGSDVDQWIAEQRWKLVRDGGWRVHERLQGHRFRVEPIINGFRVVMRAPGQEPAAWVVPAKPVNDR